VVLDSDAAGTESPTGWLVSEVNEVTNVSGDTLDAETISDTDLLNGIIKDDGEFTLWLDPHEFTA